MTEIANSKFIGDITFFFKWIKPKKGIKLKKYADFDQIGKISVQLDGEYYKNGEIVKIRKI